jgi:hypothetical protein
VGADDALADGDGVGHEGGDASAEDVIEILHAREALVENGHVRSKTDGHLRGVEPHDAAPDDHDLAPGNAGDAAHEHAETALGLLQVVRAFLNRHPTRDFAHRGEKGKRAVWGGDGLVCDPGNTAGDERLGQLLNRREVEVGEEDLSLAKLRHFRGERLLHLYDHFRFREDFVRGRQD